MSERRTRTELGWKVVSTGAGIAGAVVARNLTSSLWSRLSSSDAEPPLNPADRRISWSESIQWAVAVSVGAGLARLVSQRLAAAGWESATGSPPPGVRT